MHTLYVHELHKLHEHELFQAADQARLVNRAVGARRWPRLTRSVPSAEKNARNVHQARNLATL